MNSFDVAVLHWFNSYAGRSHGFDMAATYLTDYASIIFAVLFAFFFFVRPGETVRMRRTIILAGLSGIVALISSVIIALLVYRARPFIFLPPQQIHLLIPHAADSSFPSDHATGSAAFAVGMWRAPSRTAKWTFIIIALLVGMSRLFAGVHWPSDIVASFILGGLSAQVMFALVGPLSPILDRALFLLESLEQRLRRREC